MGALYFRERGLMGIVLMLLIAVAFTLCCSSPVHAEDAVAASAMASVNVGDWIDVAAKVVAGAAAVAAVVPVPNRVNSSLGFLRRVIDFLAMNFGHAKNKQ